MSPPESRTPGPSASIVTSGPRPRIFVTAEPVPGLLSLDDLRVGIRSGFARELWEGLRSAADADLGRKPYAPTDRFPGRSDVDADHANRDYVICHRAALRVQRAAIAHLITGERKYRDDALRQIVALLDERQWPEWRDFAHKGMEIDLRAGQLSPALALAYDWLHPSLDVEQRRWLVDGIDQCGITPFFRDVESGVSWANGTNNWMTRIVGGHGIAGLALAEDHPRSQDLVDYSLPRMQAYFGHYGWEGEFNESVAYANAHFLPIQYFAAYRYATRGDHDRLSEFPVPDTCRWLIHLTVPPGRVVDFGDGHVDAPVKAALFPAVAAATRDPALQWFYLHHARPEDPGTEPEELLWYDTSLEPREPDWTLGRAYQAHSACISNRTSWNPGSAACVVYGKAGHGNERHGHHDAGQVCIDAFAERLIVDLGSPPAYAADFFSDKRYEYYNASVKGHNVFVIGGREMRTRERDRAEIVASEFDRTRGGTWSLDLTGLYDGARSITRTVVHLLPGTVVVLDRAELEAEEEVSLRWHTVTSSAPNGEGAFTVSGERASVSAQIVCLEGGPARFLLDHHEYRPPYNRHRLGDEYPQRHEPYVEALTTSSHITLLSLFQVWGPNAEPVSWTGDGAEWAVDAAEGAVTVSCTDELRVQRGDSVWNVPGARPPDSSRKG